MNILIFLVISVMSSIFCHVLIKSYIPAAFFSSVTTAVCFQFLGYFVVGYLDPLFIVALIITWLISFIIALLIGIPFFLERRKIGDDPKRQ